jgi:hypothetical protein
MYNFNVDHYAVLGIPPGADLQTIKHAYRMRALESHPDRGGSHEAMLAVIEAYEILSNPEMRRTYDKVRADGTDHETLQKANADASWARGKANEYPRDGKEFESWLNSIVRDFTEAKFAAKEMPMFPTVQNSTSGCLFLLIGAIAGGWAGYHFFGFGKGDNSSSGRALIGTAGAGAFVAMWIHKAIGYLLRPPHAHFGTSANQASESRGSFASPQPTATRSQQASGLHPGGSILAVIAGIIGLILFTHSCTRTVSFGYFGSEEEIDWPAVLFGTAVLAVIGYVIGSSAKPRKPTNSPGAASGPPPQSLKAVDTHCTHCPQCGKHLRVPTSQHGVRVRCPSCQQVFPVG